MTTETSNDVLASGAHDVVDAETFRTWVDGPLKAALPHRALYCGQSVAHSGGFAAIQKWSFGLSQDYLDGIECAGGNVRSPMLTRLMRSGGPEFFDLHLDRQDDRHMDPIWRDNFQKAGWRNLLGLAHREGEGDELVFTSAAFYDVQGVPAGSSNLVHSTVMAHLHTAMCRLLRPAPPRPTTQTAHSFSFTQTERAIVALVLQGKSNKEIAKRLEKSNETVKRQLAVLMQRLNVRNRTELAHLIYSSGYAQYL